MARGAKIVVVGGSIAGMAAAAVLHRLGSDVTVMERLKQLGDRGAGLVVDISLIEKVTARTAADIVALPVSAIHSMIQQPGAELVDTSKASSIYSTNWKALHAELASAIGGCSLVHATVTGIEPTATGVSVSLGDGARIDADGVVLADGYDSRFLPLVDPSAEPPRYAGYIVSRVVLDESSLPPDLQEVVFDGRLHSFNRTPYSSPVYATPGAQGELAAGSRRANWALYLPVPVEELRELMGDEAGTPRNTVPWGGFRADSAERILSAVDAEWPEMYRRLAAQARPRPESLMATAIYDRLPTRLAAGRIAVIGDAAHVASPVTGSGAAAALQDALSLAQALDQASGDVREAFAAYEGERLTPVQDLVAAGRAWGELFLTPDVTPPNGPIVLGNPELAATVAARKHAIAQSMHPPTGPMGRG
jgi:2-polyprenyl-6-methoxyphenol hydroxylase-like FAD-dependent oxidoreductase